MPYPPPTLPSNRSNTTPQFDNHPSDHNAISDAITDIVNELGPNPSNGEATVQAWIDKVRELSFEYTDQQHAIAMNSAAGKVAKSGDSMTGPLNVGGDGIATVGSQVHQTGRLRIQSNDVDACIRIDVVGAANVNGAFLQRYFRAGNPIGGITSPAPGTTAFVTSSDPRLKERVGDLDDAATRVQLLGRQAYRGRWALDDDDAEWDMLDATAIRDVAPYAVSGEPDAVDVDGNIDPMQVAYSSLVPLLFSALANALDRIDELETRLN
jgi:hypothetical protein